MTLKDQFTAILTPRLDFTMIELDMANRVDKQMKENVDKGVGFSSSKVTDRYDREYEPKYSKRRSREGYQTTFTDLQKGRKRIKNTIVEAQDGAVISFAEGGNIFKYHNEGITYKNGLEKMRSIFPKSNDSVPDELINATRKLLTKQLRGQQ